MWKFILVVLLLTGCAQLPPSAEDIQAKRLDPVPGKAVIYIVRDNIGPHLDHSLWLDDSAMITTHTGTYYRWEVAPGTHRIMGGWESTAAITLNVEAGKIYFVHHIVYGVEWNAAYLTGLRQLDDQAGRARVARDQLL